MIYFLFALALFSAAVTLHSLSRLLGVAFSDKKWVSTLGPFINYLYIAIFGSLAVMLFTKTIPEIFG